MPRENPALLPRPRRRPGSGLVGFWVSAEEARCCLFHTASPPSLPTRMGPVGLPVAIPPGTVVLPQSGSYHLGVSPEPRESRPTSMGCPQSSQRLHPAVRHMCLCSCTRRPRTPSALPSNNTSTDFQKALTLPLCCPISPSRCCPQPSLSLGAILAEPGCHPCVDGQRLCHPSSRTVTRALVSFRTRRSHGAADC